MIRKMEVETGIKGLGRSYKLLLEGTTAKRFRTAIIYHKRDGFKPPFLKLPHLLQIVSD